MTNGEFHGHNLTQAYLHWGADEASRFSAVIGHVTIALHRHVRQLQQDGVVVPHEVEELAGFLVHLARIRQAPPNPTHDAEVAAPYSRTSDRLLVTKGEAAERLGVSVRTIERLVATARLPQVRIDRLARFRVSDLEEYVRNLAPQPPSPSDPDMRNDEG